MVNGWQEIPLKEVAKPVLRPVPVEPGNTYRTIGVKWWGMGAYERETIDGSQTAAKTLSIVHDGDLIINKIWVRHGSVAIATQAVDGCAGSGEFPTFKLDLNRIDPRWIHWQTKMKSFWEKCDNLSRGTSGKNRIKPELFLTINIPLPPLTEQRRIVTRIEALAVRIAEARSLRRDAEEECQLLLRSILMDKSFGEPIPTPMKELVTLRTPDVIVNPNESYHFAGVYSFSRGVFRGIRRQGNQFAYPKLTRLHTNNFTYPKLMAWEGAYGIVPPECDGLVVSTEFPVFELNQEKILPETMAVYFRNPSIWETLSGQSTGTNVRRRRLNPQTFLNYKFPLPPKEQQLLLREASAKVSALRALQESTRRELESLLPSVLDRAFKGEL